MLPVQLRDLDILVMSQMTSTILPDQCIILRYTEGAQDSRGMPTITYVPEYTDPGQTLLRKRACSFTSSGRRERGSSGEQLALEEGSIRFPDDVSIDQKDRVLLVTRFGRELTTPERERTFQLSAPARPYLSCITFPVKLVEPSS